MVTGKIGEDDKLEEMARTESIVSTLKKGLSFVIQ
jgi:hypothetical protein